MLEVDAVLAEVGEFGRYQALTYLLLCLPVLFSAANSLTYVFTAGVPPYRCRVPGCDADDDAAPPFAQPWLQLAIPPLTPDGSYRPAQCERYVRNASVADCAADAFDPSRRETCNEWVFYPGEKTIVNQVSRNISVLVLNLFLFEKFHFSIKIQ